MIRSFQSNDPLYYSSPPPQKQHAAAEGTETPQPTALPTPSPVFSSMELGETGDVAEVYIHRDESGYFPLMPDAFVDDVPNATTTCTRLGKDLGGDVIAYLKDSFSFAWYVTQDDPSRGISGDGAMYSPEDDPPPILCVLAFSGEGSGKLVGYFIGQPLEVDQDTIRIDLTLCDFALEPLYEQERAAFLAGADLLDVERVAPDTDFEALGVEYSLPGFYTGETDHLTQYDCQRYHLWQALTAPDPRCYAQSVQSLRTRLASSAPREHYHYQFNLLLDKDLQPIAYTWHY